MKNPAFSLSDITYEQGLQLLFLRKQALDSGKLPRMPKAAYANVAPLQAIGAAVMAKVAEVPFWDNTNLLRNTALLGVAGTGVGAAAGLGFANSTDKKYKRRALQGGLAGGLLGGGLGYLNTAEAPAAAGAAPPLKMTEIQQAEFDRIRALPTREERAKAVQNLTNMAGSSSPKWNTAGGVVVGAGMAGTLANMSFVDRRIVAQMIRDNLGNDKVNPTPLNRLSADGTGFSPQGTAAWTPGRPDELAELQKKLRRTNTWHGTPHPQLLLDMQAAFPNTLGKQKLDDLSKALMTKRFTIPKSIATALAGLIPAGIGAGFGLSNSNVKADAAGILPHLPK